MCQSSRFLAALAIFAAASHAHAGDWPQVLGPDRNGTAPDETIRVRWGTDSPPTLWQHEVGSGFAGPSVRGKTVVVYHRLGKEEIVEALDRDSGNVLWVVRFPTEYAPSYTDDDGPRVVPLIKGKHVFLYGAMGELRCLKLEDGELVWERKTFEDFNTPKYRGSEPPEGYFGVGTSPIVVGDKIVVNVGGGEKEAGIVAFDKSTGQTLWKSTSEHASYSSPILAQSDGIDHLVFATRLSLLSVAPESGNVRFQIPFGRKGPTVTAATPVLIDNHVLITASYGIGAALVKLEGASADLVWRDSDLLASQYTTCIEVEGSLVGIDGRQDGPAADLKCFDPFTRTTHWTEPAFGYATLLRAGDTLLAMKTEGTLVAIAPSKQGYEELARTQISTTIVRALPAISDGKLFVRDKRALKCIDLGTGL